MPGRELNFNMALLSHCWFHHKRGIIVHKCHYGSREKEVCVGTCAPMHGCVLARTTLLMHYNQKEVPNYHSTFIGTVDINNL